MTKERRKPSGDDDRVHPLRNLEILDPEARFDRLTRELSERLNVPIAYVALIDGERQWLQSDSDQPTTVLRDLALCSRIILESGTLVVADAAEDPRFTASSPGTDDSGLRFYAGVPIAAPDGRVLGTVCVADRRARQLDPRDLVILQGFAKRVAEEVHAKSTVFVAYASEDTDWMLRLIEHGQALGQEGLLDLFSSRSIEAYDGSGWQVRDAVAHARLAVLLLTESFLKSKFVSDQGFLESLRSQRDEGLDIFAVLLEPCAWSEVPGLADLNVWPAADQALSSRSEAQLEDDLKEAISYLLLATGQEDGLARPVSGEPQDEPDSADTASEDEQAPLVFLSHAGEDGKAVKELADKLRAAGIRVWLDLDELKPGDTWMAVLEDGLERADAFAVYVGRTGIARWIGREVRVALDRNVADPNFRVIPILGPGADPDSLPPFLAQHHWLDLREDWQDPAQIRRFIGAIIDTPTDKIRLIPRDEIPFRGLLAFDVEHTHLFFGRDRETEDLLDRLRIAPFLAVVGDSGSGKSSLVRAGLIPALHRGRFHDGKSWAEAWKVVILRPGNDPFRELGNALLDLAPETETAARLETRQAFTRQLAEGAGGLAQCIAAVVPAGERTLVMVDQFEEVFTHAASTAERDRFIDTLLASADGSGDRPVHVLITLRADFFSQCFAHATLPDAISANQYALRRIAGEQLSEIIEKPVAMAGARLEPGLAEAILHDVGDEAGSLPLLEHTLLELWQRRTSDTLTHDSYEEIGRVQGALEHHAEETFAQLDAQEKKQARKLFLNLVTPGNGTPPTRRRARQAEILPAGEAAAAAEKVLLHLVEQRLLNVRRAAPGEDDEKEVEVAHEALIRGWDRLQGWLEEDHEFLLWRQRTRAAFLVWEESGRDTGALLRGAPLAEAQRWTEERGDELSDGGLFIAASIRRVRRIALRDRVVVAAMAILAVAASIAWAFARHQTEVAEREAVTSGRITEVLLNTFDASDPWRDGSREMTAAEILDSAARRILTDPELAGEPEIKATLMNTIGNVLYNLQEIDLAAEHFEQTLELRRELDAEDSLEGAQIKNDLAAIRLRQGEYEETRQLFTESLETRIGLLGEDHVLVAQSRCNLALLSADLGERDEALRLFEQALEIKATASGWDLAELASCHNNLAGLMQDLGTLELAKEHFEEALRIRRSLYTEDHPDVAQAMNNLGLTLHLLGGLEDSAKLHREALAMHQRRLPEDHPDVGFSLLNLAYVLEDLKQHQEGARRAAEAVEIFAAQDDDYWAAVARSVEGGCLIGLGRCARAEELLAASSEVIREQENPAINSTVERRLEELSRVCGRTVSLEP